LAIPYVYVVTVQASGARVKGPDYDGRHLSRRLYGRDSSIIAQSYAQNSGADSAGILFALAVWFGLALIPAFIANSKGRSGVGYFFFGLLFFVPALIVALVADATPRGIRTSSRAPRRPFTSEGFEQPSRYDVTLIRLGAEPESVARAITEIDLHTYAEAVRFVKGRPLPVRVFEGVGYGTAYGAESLLRRNGATVRVDKVVEAPRVSSGARLDRERGHEQRSRASRMSGFEVSRDVAAAAEQPDTPKTPAPGAPEFKTCPDCAEEVRFAARKCRFCGFVFEQRPPSVA
jgi:Uncharacterised protein family UPF0547